VPRAISRARVNAGKSIAARIETIPITERSSTKVSKVAGEHSKIRPQA
jgi:hypothetical protein